MSGNTNTILFHRSVIGESHKLKGSICQDASGSRLTDAGMRIATVADGHGDPTCFRSDLGSKTAAAVAIKHLEEFAGSHKNLKSIITNDDQGDVLRRLTDGIVSEWSSRVRKDHEEKGLDDKDLILAGRYGKVYSKGERIERIYGSTLVAALKSNDYILLIQQGDGNCFLIREDGTMEQPIPEDEKCHGNVTTSLSDDIAADEIRSVLLPLQEDVIGCFLCTDGVENGFYDDDSVEEFLLEAGKTLNDSSGEELVALLEHATANGNGDDVSIAGWIEPGFIHCADRIIETIRLRRREEEKDLVMRKLRSMEKKDEILRQKVRNAAKEDRSELMREYMEYHIKYNRMRAKAESLTER